MIILVIWALVTFPLTVLGGIAGKNTRMEFNAPCRTTKCVFRQLVAVSASMSAEVKRLLLPVYASFVAVWTFTSWTTSLFQCAHRTMVCRV